MTATSTMPELVVVHLDHITKRFGEVVAVDDLDMQILAGEFVTFLGPSGCGKSTTLRIVGGFERPDAGRVIVGGEDVTALPPNKRDVNMVFQDYALFPHMTVAGNMAFGLELKGKSRSRSSDGSTSSSLCSNSKPCASACRTNSQAASANASRSLARSLPTHAFSSSTNRSPPSTPSSAPKCSSSSRTFKNVRGKRFSSSPTIRTRRSPCRIESW